MTQVLKSSIIFAIIFLNSCAQVSSVQRNVASEADSCLKLAQQIIHAEKLPSIAKDLDDKLFAIHLTNYLPENGIIEANSLNRARFAATIHFSLGEPVISHGSGNWINKKYAILVPIKYLKDQMLNIFVQDTFVVGSFQLPKEAIILIPKGSALPKGYAGSVRTYEDNKIAEATKNLIKEEKGIEVSANSPFVKSEITVQGEIIDPKVMLKKYFDANKDLTYELHYTTIYGALDTGIYSILGEWSIGLLPSNSLSANNLKTRLIIFQKLIHEMDRRVKLMNLPTVAMRNYDNNRKALGGLINLIEVEIEFQVKYHKTFLNSRSHSTEIWKNRFDKKNLMNILTDSLEEYNDSSLIENKKIHISELARGLSFLDYFAFKKLLYSSEISSQANMHDIHKELFLTGLSSINNNKITLGELAQEFELAIKSITEDYQYHSLIHRLDLIESESMRKKLIQDPKVNELIENYRLKVTNKRAS